MLALQGIPVQQGGTVSGVLRDSRGMPAAGVRMAAVARGDVIDNTVGGSMAGIAETDGQGRFILENIPPGRYVIAAGRLDLQTYYPGTQAIADARVLTITGGTTITDIHFALNDTSFGRASSDLFSLAVQSYYSAVQPIAAVIPVTVLVENGGKLPVAANGREVSMTLSSASDQFTFPIDATAVSIPGPLSGDFSVRVEGLPANYKVKAITYGSLEITNSTFSLSAANFPTQPTSPAAQSPLPTLSAIRGISINGTTVTINVSAVPSLSATVPPSTLSITLEHIGPAKSSGVRVAGIVGIRDKASVYISGAPGVVFSDRSFEFEGVPPGRHLIAATHRFTPQAAVVVVGDSNIDGVQLTKTLGEPDITVPQTIPPAGPYPPGTIIPLPRILGTVVDEKTGMPVVEGTVTVENEDYRRTFTPDPSGRFESFSLFPGTYDVSLWLIGHVSSTMKVTVEDKDVEVKLTAGSED